ncbi:MAG: hypothetical protein JST02_01435 [Bacteroidetes bacterium]|nr:hypothetical protein [Bacteroidota bacterium]
MYFKHLFATVALFYSSLAFCQKKKITFKLGVEYNIPQDSEDLTFFGNEHDGFANLSTRGKKINIIKFDQKTLAQISDKTFEVDKASKYMISEIIAESGNNYYWIHSDWNNLETSEYLYCDKIDMASGNITTTNQKMLESTRMIGKTIGYYLTPYKYSFFFNADTSMMLVQYKHRTAEPNNNEEFGRIGLQVFDRNMQKVWGKELIMPYRYPLMDWKDFSVDYLGNAYILAKIFSTERRKEKDKTTGKPGYHYEVLKYTKESDVPEVTRIDLEDYFIHEASLTESNAHDMLITCTYSNDPNGYSAKGFFLAKLDQSGKIKKYMGGYYEFPMGEMQKFESPSTRRKMEEAGGFELPFLAIREVLNEPDNGTFIVFEEHYVSPGSKVFGNALRRSDSEVYNDAIACKLSPDGKLMWTRKIPKMQQGCGGYADIGYKLFTDSSGYYFIYLDNRKNLHLTEDEEPDLFLDAYNGQLVVTKIDNFGNVSKEVIFDVKEEKFIIYPGDLDKIGKNKLIGRAITKRGICNPILFNFDN